MLQERFSLIDCSMPKPFVSASNILSCEFVFVFVDGLL